MTLNIVRACITMNISRVSVNCACKCVLYETKVKIRNDTTFPDLDCVYIHFKQTHVSGFLQIPWSRLIERNVLYLKTPTENTRLKSEKLVSFPICNCGENFRTK